MRTDSARAENPALSVVSAEGAITVKPSLPAACSQYNRYQFAPCTCLGAQTTSNSELNRNGSDASVSVGWARRTWQTLRPVEAVIATVETARVFGLLIELMRGHPLAIRLRGEQLKDLAVGEIH